MTRGKPRVTLVTAATPHRREPIEKIEPALGILTLAAILRPRFDVRVVELNHIWNQGGGCLERFSRLALETLLALPADVFGFSSICGSYPTTLRLANAVACEWPGVRVVLGGPQASVVDRATLETFPGIHAVIRGEADETFPRYLDAIFADESPRGIDGLTYREGHRIHRNRNAAAVLDLDFLPLPAFDLHPGIEDAVTLPIEAGRGCPFACRFCSTNDFFRRRFRLKSPQAAIAQMRNLHASYSVRTFTLTHDMFTVDRRRVESFCDALIEIGSPYCWTCSARTDCVDQELLERMSEAGCGGIFFGIETGSPRMQRVIDKDLDLVKAREVLRIADQMGMRATASLIAGYPDETPEDFQGTLRFFLDAGALAHVEPQLHILSPLAETPLTTEWSDRLYLDDEWAVISETGAVQDPVDRLLVQSHIDLFGNFYSFPCELDRQFLRRARDWISHLEMRANALLRAIDRLEIAILDVFEAFQETAGDTIRQPAYFENWDFIVDFTEFAERRYDDVNVTVLGRFFRELARSHRNQTRAKLGGAVTLGRNVHFIEVAGDVARVLQALGEREAANPDCVGALKALAVRSATERQCEIFELPSVALPLFQLAARGAAPEQIMAEYERLRIRFGTLSPADVAAQLMDHYKNQGLIHGDPLRVATEFELGSKAHAVF